jgi:galactonate dehydratase
VQEYPPNDATGVKADLVDEPLKRDGGYLRVPDRPGIGIDLNEEAFAKYPVVPYSRVPLINADGSLREY